ncbi:MAG: NTP transferase domain-containing protein, partial [Bacteroidales bacterium]|nr:NTP transferase domain-containing protein [Bacteroidales bacterium]
MKTIVLAAGYATRLYPLTENFPKPLLEIGKSTILDRLLDDIDTIPEIDGHIVVTNHKFAGIFEAWAAQRQPPGQAGGDVGVMPGTDRASRKPVEILDDGTSTNETRLGAVRDLILAIETFGLNEDLLVVAAD